MDANKGFSFQEVISRVQTYVGDTSLDFLTYLQQSVSMAQFRYCKAHDWGFLQRSDVLASINSSGGVNVFDLSEITDPLTGNTVQIFTQDINTIHMKWPGIVLRKISIQDLRRFDPQETNGTLADNPSMWCPISDTTFKVWPDTFGGGGLITFTGALANQLLPQITVASNSLFPQTQINISSYQEGGQGKSEVQVIQFDNIPISGSYTLTFNGQTTAAISYTSTATQIQTALTGLTSIGSGNVLVSSDPTSGLLSIDCKISPLTVVDTSVTTGSMVIYPIIPAKYQEGFIKYMIAIGLDYVDDSRADQKKQEALMDIRGDIQDDLSMKADVDLPRIRSMFEARLDGAGANLNALLFGFLAPYD